MIKPAKDEVALDPKVVSRIAHVLWRIENDAIIKRSTKEQNVLAWNKDKRPFLEKARMIVRMASNIEMVAVD